MKRNGPSIRNLLLLLGGVTLAASVTALAAPKRAPAKRTAAPAVKAVDGPGLKKAIAGQKGKVVLLNLWATWCQPCVEEFPDLVKLQNNFKSKGLVVMAASVDEPDTQAKVKPFLAAQKATFPAFVRKPGDVEKFINALDPNWSGAVPTTYLYDRQGRRVGKPLTGGHTYAQLAAAVAPLLK